jgi:hypothetical protein
LNSDKFCYGLCWFFLALGVFSRIFIYAKGQDLWLDEALLWEDLKPLIGSFCLSEFALRFLPLLAGTGTLLLSYIFALREFGVRFACIFLFLLVSSDSLLFYSVNFSFYGTEAFLVAMSLCVWSYSKRNRVSLISLISLVSIFSIMCNYGEYRGGAYWLNLDAASGPVHGFIIFLIWFRDFFVQMLGRHFINFHYFVFGKFIWINALLFVLPFCIGSVFLYREKKALLISIFSAVFILLSLYLLKIAPLEMPYNDFMRIMRNWSQTQVTSSKYLTFIFPLVLIPVAFFIHRIFLRVRTQTLIPVLCIFALLALSGNLIRMHKGIGSPESTVLLQHIKENAGGKSLVFTDSVSRPIFKYYVSKNFFKDNPNLNYFYVKEDGYMYLNDSIFIGKYSGSIEELFDVMKNFKAENGFFFLTYNSFYSIRESNELIGYIQQKYEGKSKGFQSKLAGAAWVRF